MTQEFQLSLGFRWVEERARTLLPGLSPSYHSRLVYRQNRLTKAEPEEIEEYLLFNDYMSTLL